MLGRTHFIAGMAAGAASGAALNGHPLLGGLLGGVGGLLADIDHPGSILGRLLPFLSIPISIVFPHRTITHTLWFAIATAFLPVFLLWLCVSAGLNVSINIYLAGLYVFAGSLSHLVLDALTNSGIAPFWPISIRIRGPLQTGDPLVEIPLAVILLVSVLNATGI